TSRRGYPHPGLHSLPDALRPDRRGHRAGRGPDLLGRGNGKGCLRSAPRRGSAGIGFVHPRVRVHRRPRQLPGDRRTILEPIDPRGSVGGPRGLPGSRGRAVMELVVLGAGGGWAGPRGAACGYLLSADGFNLWLDLGTGTMANLQEHVELVDVDAVAVSHRHFDHFLDMYPFYLARWYGTDLPPIELFAPPGMFEHALQ